MLKKILDQSKRNYEKCNTISLFDYLKSQDEPNNHYSIIFSHHTLYIYFPLISGALLSLPDRPETPETQSTLKIKLPPVQEKWLMVGLKAQVSL